MTALEKSKCTNMADEIGDILTLTPSLYKALCDTPREIFAPVTRHAYSLDAQPIGGNQWISSPLTVAKMTLALEAEDIDNALEIGCGSGYQAAILSHLAHRVFSVERIEKLASEATTSTCVLTTETSVGKATRHTTEFYSRRRRNRCHRRFLIS